MIEELKKEFDKEFGLMKMDNLLQWDWIEKQLKKAYIEGSNDCHKSLSSCAGVSLGDSQPVPEPNHNCENCIYLNKYDDKLSSCFCKKHGRFLSQFYNEVEYTLNNIGCNQFEQKT